MNAVHFVEGFVCANTYEDANERIDKVKAEFKKQLLQFQKNVLLPANSWEIAKVIYTGKLKAYDKISTFYKKKLLTKYFNFKGA